MRIKALSFLFIPVILVASAVNAAEIYNNNRNKLDFFGSIGSFYYFSNKNRTSGDQSYMNVGFKGQTKINDYLTGYGHWEYQIHSENTPWVRKAFVGLKFGNIGSFDYGRNNDVVFDISAWTGVFPKFGDDFGSNDCVKQCDNSFITYRNTNFFDLVEGLDFSVQYQKKNDEMSHITKNAGDVIKQNGVSGSLTYDLGNGFGVGGAVSSTRRTSFQNYRNFNISDYAKIYTGGFKYDANNIYLATQYTQEYNVAFSGAMGLVNKTQRLEMIAQYQSNFGLHPSISYLQAIGRNLEKGYDDQDIVKCVDLGAIYNFNQGMSTYINYKINLLNESDFTRQARLNTSDMVSIGLVYQF